MNKKRGVVVSTINQQKTISKSKSAHTHPLPPQTRTHPLHENHNQIASRSGAIPPLENEQLAESNLLSEEPERMINQAYYTYQEPESNQHHDYDKYEENEEYVIESMQRRKELKERERKEEEKRKMAEKSKAAIQAEEKVKKEKEVKLKSSAAKAKINTLKSLKDTVFKEKKPKSDTVNVIPYLRENPVRRETIIVNTKPKPLQFSVNMLDKMYMHSPHRKKEDVFSMRMGDRIDNQKTSLTVRNTINQDSSNLGQNLNCKKLPFRFQGIF